jgi:sugar transferase (PEP-CTERM system associated)
VLTRSQKFWLLILDFILFVACLGVVSHYAEGFSFEKILMAAHMWLITWVVLVLYYVFGLYELPRASSTLKFIARIFVALAIALGLIIFYNYLGAKERSGIFGRGILISSLLFFALLSSFNRWLLLRTLERQLKKTRWLFVCTREILQQFRADLVKNLFHGQIFYLIDAKLEGDEKDVIGEWDQVDDILKKNWSSVVVALDEAAPRIFIERLMLARFENKRVRDLVQFYEEVWQKVPLYYLGPRWFLLTEGFGLIGNPIRSRIKRVMDLGISLTLLLLAWPIMLITWIVVRLESPGDAIYKQVRTGKNSKTFVIYKFRSMRSDAEKGGVRWASLNDNRITKVGNFIRKTRIDELPQLVNIIKGQMSFVGPRPERPEFNLTLENEIPFYGLRHIVSPGLTGWAQVLYPYGASVEDSKEKLQYDLYYIKNYSTWLDISIVLKTITVVLFGRGR